MQLKLTKNDTTKIIRCTSSLEPYENTANIKIGSNYVRLTSDNTRVGNPPNIQVTSPSGIIYYVDEFPNPDINNAIMGTSEEIQDMVVNYVPPTFIDIFNTWERFGDDRHQGLGPYTGGAASWSLSGNNILVGEDTIKPTGFVSPDKYTNYTHEVNISCYEHHCDTIGIIIAYTNVGTTPHMLVAVRSGGTASVPWPGWYTSNNSFTVLYHTTATAPRGTWIPDPHWNNTGNHLFRPIKQWQTPAYAVSATAAGSAYWDQLSPTKVKITKNGSIITATTSPYRSGTLNSASTITVDLSLYPELEWATGPVSYGYMALSNPNATFRNVTFTSNENATDTIYNTDTGEVWKYTDGVWITIPEKVWDYLPLPTLITSTTGTTYVVDDGSITPRG